MASSGVLRAPLSASSRFDSHIQKHDGSCHRHSSCSDSEPMRLDESHATDAEVHAKEAHRHQPARSQLVAPSPINTSKILVAQMEHTSTAVGFVDEKLHKLL